MEEKREKVREVRESIKVTCSGYTGGDKGGSGKVHLRRKRPSLKLRSLGTQNKYHSTVV